MLSYENRKGKTIQLRVSRHAYSQFIKRYKIAYPDDSIQNKDIQDMLERVFKTTNKVKKLNRREQTRLKRYGEDTMFFRTNFFTFIIQNKEVVTVELSDKNMRHLN